MALVQVRQVNEPANHPSYLTAVEMMHHPAWGTQFPGDVEDHERTWRASQITMTFLTADADSSATDAESSPPDCDRALELAVRSILRHVGRLRERVGNAVMGTFINPFQALVAMLEAVVTIGREVWIFGLFHVAQGSL